MGIIAKYKFNNTLADLLPEFNSEFTSDLYTVTDEIDGDVTIRTIESDTLPTMMRFGRVWVEGELTTDDRTDSLLEILEMDTSELTNCYSIFRYCSNLTGVTCEWDTSNVTNMQYMFYGCNNLSSLDVSNWDTSNVTNMGGMFYGCNNLTSLDVSNFNTSNVTTMSDMFNFCYLLEEIDVSNWVTSKTTQLNGLFGRCRQLSSIDISNFNLGNLNVNDVLMYYHMFIDIPNTKVINFGNVEFPEGVDFNKLFGISENPENLQSLEKFISNNSSVIERMADILPDRSSKLNPGVVVTNATISDEAMNTISGKNWSLRKMVAQYKFDAVTHENLIPKFNTEFTESDYIITDSVSESVIDDIQWTDGYALTADTGVLTDDAESHVSDFIVIQPNVAYRVNQPTYVYWYDENKAFINNDYVSEEDYNAGNDNMVSPVNARYARFTQYSYREGLEVNSKVVTRTIESVAGKLPTQIYFGNLYAASSYYTGGFWSSLLTVYEIITSSLITMRGLFRWCDRLTNVNRISTWDTSNVVDMGYLFDCCYSLTSLDVSNWDTSKVTTMNSMFNGCNKLTSLDVSNFNTSNVTNMQYMFNGCNKLTSLDVGNWNTSNVTNMQYMFSNCNKLASLDVSNFDTSNVTNMQYMFYGCNNLSSLDVSNWDTSNVTNMQYMFAYCKNLTSLDVSNFNTSKVTTMNSMFASCKNLTSLDVSNFNTSNVTNMQSMFNDCNNLSSLDVSNWDTSKVTNMKYMFYNCNTLKVLHLSNVNNQASKIEMFYSCTSLITLDISNLVVPEYGNNFFGTKCPVKYLKINNIDVINTIADQLKYTRTAEDFGIILTTLDISTIPQETRDLLASKNWTITNEFIKVAEYVFNPSIYSNLIPVFNNDYGLGYFYNDTIGEDGLVTRIIESVQGLPALMRFGSDAQPYIEGSEVALLEVLEMNTSELTNCYRMFRYCTNMTSIACEWDTSKVTNMYCMFYGCNSLTSLDVSSFNTSKVTIMDSMFRNCYTLTTLDLSNFDTSQVTSMGYMFNDCNSLTSLDLSSFDTSNVTNMSSMFVDTLQLTDIGMLNCDKSTIQKVANVLPNDTNRTIWYKETNVEGVAAPSHVGLREYFEGNVEIVLNSPLLERDSIEVVDGKLSHVHRYGMMVLDGSEYFHFYGQSENCIAFYYYNTVIGIKQGKVLCNNFGENYEGIALKTNEGIEALANDHIHICISKSKLSTLDLNGFKQWLQANPTTVVYELVEPYYEEITPLQSSLTLRTFNECNIQIITALPIKTKITYRTNITSAYELERQVNSVDTVDLDNLLEEEVE